MEASVSFLVGLVAGGALVYKVMVAKLKRYAAAAGRRPVDSGSSVKE